ncbi:MAG: hypothetical protein ACSW8G_05285, partial [Bacillota bacterium]
ASGVVTVVGDAASAAEAAGEPVSFPTGLPSTNMLFYDLAGGSKAIVRPSGTEPKVKLYLLAQGSDAASAGAALETIKSALLGIVRG